MIAELSELEPGALATRRFDVCIIGAGPAGITLATHLAAHLDVLLLEGGGLDWSEESQALYAGGQVGREYFPLDATRLRYFGGSSNHWAGWCQALDEADFEPKDHIPHSGWPIRKADLDPYFNAASELLDISDEPGEELRYRQELDRMVNEDGLLSPYRFMWSAPTRFGEKFRSVIQTARNVTCFLNANLTDIRLNDAGKAVASVSVADLAGRSHSFAAQTVVVAAGGLENPRILLNCVAQVPSGIGNGNDLVGRFFAEHPQHTLGSFVLEDDFRAIVTGSLSPEQMMRRAATSFYSATPNFTERHKTGNFSISVLPRVRESGGSFSDRLRRAVCGPDFASEALDAISFGDRQICTEGQIHLSTEQVPNPDSRVRLGQEKDRFGLRRIELDWRMSDVDKRTVQFASVYFARLFAERGVGRMRLANWVLADDHSFAGPSEDAAAGHHHMGTTRMADDPKAGVVDRDCRVHGLANLYVAGSSVFPTVGHANPTFTIVQLTLRLADHLNTVLAPTAA